MPPIRLERSKVKYLIRSTLFDIEVTQRGVRLNTRPEPLKSAKLPLAEWISFFRMLAIFSGGAATLNVVPERLPSATMTMTAIAFADDGQSGRNLNALESAETLFRLAGIEAPSILLDDIFPGAARYVAIAGLFSGSNDIHQLNFRAQWPRGAIPDEIDALYIDAVHVAGMKLAFSCIAKMFHESSDDSGESVLQWKSRAINGREVMAIRDFSDDYEKFAARSKVETGINTVMMATYDEGDPKPG